MCERTIIAVGLGLFVAVAAFPVWHGLAAGGSAAPPALAPARGANCVEDKQWMIANHPRLLEQWRDDVVRHGNRDYTSATYATHHQKSLTKTCIACHGSREEFCDRCHNYANVRLECWNCHLGSTGNKP